MMSFRRIEGFKMHCSVLVSSRQVLFSKWSFTQGFPSAQPYLRHIYGVFQRTLFSNTLPAIHLNHQLSPQYSIGCSMRQRSRVTFSIDGSLLAWALTILPSFHHLPSCCQLWRQNTSLSPQLDCHGGCQGLFCHILTFLRAIFHSSPSDSVH